MRHREGKGLSRWVRVPPAHRRRSLDPFSDQRCIPAPKKMEEVGVIGFRQEKISQMLLPTPRTQGGGKAGEIVILCIHVGKEESVGPTFRAQHGPKTVSFANGDPPYSVSPCGRGVGSWSQSCEGAGWGQPWSRREAASRPVSQFPQLWQGKGKIHSPPQLP